MALRMKEALHLGKLNFASLVRLLRWVLGEVWEKINVVETWRSLKKLGKKHGRRFFIAAVLWECVEDLVFPFLSWKAGVPKLIPLFLVLHFEPIVYPVFFWAFRTWDRAQGREPWEPDRTAQSTWIRSATKAAVHMLALSGWYVAILIGEGLSPAVLWAYVGLMAAFGFIHERIWHDSNFAIDAEDHVHAPRVVAKTFTSSVVSAMTLYPLCQASFGAVPWRVFLACQGVWALSYGVFEAVWSQNRWGILPVAAKAHAQEPKVELAAE